MDLGYGYQGYIIFDHRYRGLFEFLPSSHDK